MEHSEQMSTKAAHAKDAPTEKVIEPATPKINTKPSVGMALAVFIALLIGVVGGFAAGVHTSSSNGSTAPSTQNGAGGMMNGRMGGRGMGMGMMGTVSQVTDDSIVVQNDRTGASTTYTITEDTTITKSGATIDISDIKSGNNVMIQTSNAEDSTTATSIVINPTMGNTQSFSQPDESEDSTLQNT